MAFARLFLICWLKRLLKLSIPIYIIMVKTIYQKNLSLMTKPGWYLRISKLENLTKNLIISDRDYLPSPKLLKTKNITLTSFNLSLSKFIKYFTFLFSKPSNLPSWNWKKKEWEVMEIFDSKYQRHKLKYLISWIRFSPENNFCQPA